MLEKLKQLLGATPINEIHSDTQTVADNNSGNVSRANAVYGEDTITKQQLYEKWACKESWHLREEGIPLLLGLNPENSDAVENAQLQQIDELWQHACDCVTKKLLVVNDIEAPTEEWHVAPADLYCWATVGRVSVPQELSALMEFVLQTIKQTAIVAQQEPAEGSDSANDSRYQKHCEITLGAAVALMVNSPEVCQTSSGKFRAALISAEILKNAEAWFGKDEPLLAQAAMTDLLDKYIARARLPVTSSGN